MIVDPEAPARTDADPAQKAEPAWVAVVVMTAVTALFTHTAWQRYGFLMTSPFPVGVDGYFYPVQLRSLLETGSLYYPSSPLGLWLMAPFALLSDPIVGAKLAAAILPAAIVFPMYLLGRHLGGCRATGFLAAALAAASAQSFYFSLEFVKNGIGLTILCWYLVALAHAQAKPTRRRIAVAVAALVATMLTHKAPFALALLLTAIVFADQVLLAHPRTATATRRAKLVAGAAAALLLILIGVAQFLPGWIGRSTPLLSSLLADHAEWSLPILAPGQGRAPRLFGYEALIALACAVIALGVILRTKLDQHRGILFTLIFVALFVGIPFLDVSSGQTLGFRLRLYAFIPMCLLAAFLAGRALRAQPQHLRYALIVPFALGWVYARRAPSMEGVVITHPALAAAVMNVEGKVPADGVVIVPERHIAFMVSWYARVPARLRPEPVPAARRWRLLPLAFTKIGSPLERAIDRARDERPPELTVPMSLHPGHRNGLVLMPESTWDWILARVPPKTRAMLLRWPTI